MRIVALLMFAACTQSPPTATTSPGPDAPVDDSHVDDRCAGDPEVGAAAGFDHAASNAIAEAGEPRHRGFDLVAAESAAVQRIAGSINYGAVDKGLENELVDVFACRGSAWTKLGTTRTDGEGHFALELGDGARLPLGLRDMFASVVGDRSGARFLAYVTRDATPLFVSDVDGTLTASENAFAEDLALGGVPAANAGAAAALGAQGEQLVYLTARGDQFTAQTRQWLDDHGFPRGPLRLAPAGALLPGTATTAFKESAMAALNASMVMATGLGNRASDIDAYEASGIPADRIFIELPEFREEVAPAIAAGRAIGFESYDAVKF